MQNPMLSKLRPAKQVQTNNNMLAMLQNSNNPQQLINNILTNNPQLTTLINQYGNGDPKAAFYEYARRTGQNPQQILNMIQSLMKR